MPNQEQHLERLRNSCLAADISKFLKREIEITKPGFAKVIIPFNSQLTQNADYLHGAIIFEAADTAGFIAANSIETTNSVLTVDYHINFIRPVKNEGIYAIGEVVNSGKNIIVVQSKVYSENHKLVACGQGTYLVSSIPLTDVKDYTAEVNINKKV